MRDSQDLYACVSLRSAAPTIEEDEAQVAATAGSRALLACNVDGLPRPEVTWLKNGKEIEMSNSRYTVQRTGSLQLSVVALNDSGLYECVASNDAGTARREVVLSVQGRTTYTTHARCV